MSTIKPPEGYRRLKVGEVYPDHYLSWFGETWNKTAGYFSGRKYGIKDTRIIAVKRTRNRQQPTAAECFLFLSKRKFLMRSHKGAAAVVLVDGQHTAKTPLAAVRKAIKSERAK